MPRYQWEVKVLSIMPATEAIKGDMILQVYFGTIGKPLNPALVPQGVQNVAANSMVLFLPSEGECPYVVGSKWILTVGEDGEVSLKRAEIVL